MKKMSGIMFFLVPFLSLIVSFYMSIGLGWTPCSLCYIQRGLLIMLLLYAISWLLTKRKVIWGYRFISSFGVIVASYHHYIQFHTLKTPFCISETPCEIVYWSYGWITVPFISASIFSFLVVNSFLCSKESLTS